MPINVSLGHVSNAFMIVALVIYSLAVVAFAGDFAFARPKRTAAASGAQQTQDRAATLATVGAASSPAAAASAGDAPPAGPGTVAGDAAGARAAGAAMAGPGAAPDSMPEMALS
ncbi:MAG: hypothetical protein WAK82_29940, partial [Streptosporangiaceae bacterium]